MDLPASSVKNIISEVTSEKFKSNFKYDLIFKNCQHYSTDIFSDIIGESEGKVKYLSDRIHIKDYKFDFNNLDEYELFCDYIYDKILSFAPNKRD